MEIRRFQDSDVRQIVVLFFETIHSVNLKDYSQVQLDAWAPEKEKELMMQSWKASLKDNFTYVAVINGNIVGFADMTLDGYLNRLYVHKNWQRKGIASSLASILESEAEKLGLSRLTSDVSITAKSFFEQRGYQLTQTQCVERKGVQLVNYKMIKKFPAY